MIQIYNTLTGTKVPFTPLVPGQVSMYLCGPTVYSDCHIGHLMGPVLFDAVARWFAARGFAVRFVNNITDIDDKIIDRSISTGESTKTITERYTAQYFELLAATHVKTISQHPRCTEYVPHMVSYIDDLIRAGRAYLAQDGVYFDVQRQPGYGKLSRRTLAEMESDAGKDSKGLRARADFALWKFAKAGEPSWPSPWGDGRPGWHIECSVMSHHALGADFDIHAGGEELKFPHHENEIAQGEAHGGGYAQVWMHNNLVQYQGSKVSKSDPRMREEAFAKQFQAKHVIAEHGGAVIRFLLLNGHYRRPVDFGPTTIQQITTALGRLHRQLGDLLDAPAETNLTEILARPLPASLLPHRARFVAAMDDDFNTGNAIAELFQALAVPAPDKDIARLLVRDLGRLLGLFQPGDARSTTTASSNAHDERLATCMAVILELRQRARANRDFATSDFIRDRLSSVGIQINDSKTGTTWTG